jgi:uncharacterized membrane protein (DUF4010 family)
MDGLIWRLALALAIGLLVGLERGWRERDEPAGSRTAGIRTYGISGLLGGLFAALSGAFADAALLVAGFLGFAAVFAWFKLREARNDDEYSVTAVIAAMCVFALGALAVAGDYRVAAAGGAALAAVLASREMLHGLLKKLTWVELRSAVILAVMTAIILPLLPDRTIDPWGGLNPREIWFFTVLIAAISYLGYVAVRVLGTARGLLVSGIAGALVSSTAVTVALARIAGSAASSRPLTGAAALAAMVSILRVVGIVAIIEPAVLPAVAPAALSAAILFAACGALFLWRSEGAAQIEAPARNPFDLVPLLLFALLFAIVSTASAALAGRMGGTGLLATTALSGTFDVDVAVLSALRLVGQSIDAGAVGLAVLAALAANALGRLFLAALAGPTSFWLPLAGATLAALVLGYAIHAVSPSWFANL